jgi:hypothetical protein
MKLTVWICRYGETIYIIRCNAKSKEIYNFKFYYLQHIIKFSL